MSVTYKEKLSDKDYEYAQRYLGESKEARVEALAELNEWLDDNTHINAQRDPAHLLHFLRGAKFQLDKAKLRIKL